MFSNIGCNFFLRMTDNKSTTYTVLASRFGGGYMHNVINCILAQISLVCSV